MRKQNTSRASDLGSMLRSDTTGFTVRRRTGVGKIVHFFLLGAMVILGAALLVYYKSPEGSMLAVAAGACFGLVAVNLEKLKKVKESLEFMNALFSSALGRGYRFCCIVKTNGDIVFFNRPFQALFPAFMAQKERTLTSLLAVYNVPQAQRDVLSGYLTSNSEGSLTTTIRENDGASQSLTLTIEPIERPTGFMLLRGK